MVNGNFLSDLFLILSFIIIFEGILPFLYPSFWKKCIIFFLKKSNRFIRVSGFLCVLFGFFLFFLVR